MAAKRILIVDDEVPLLELSSDVPSDAGYAVDSAQTAEKAFDLGDVLRALDSLIVETV